VAQPQLPLGADGASAGWSKCRRGIWGRRT